MICPTCNLHYPEHLNFCRRCGNTLAETMDQPVVEAPCCTRCGARFVTGENFCQQCGYRLSQRSQETVVGGCYGCGTPWRSGWLYCRKCGLDRDQALIGPVSASAEGVAEGVVEQGDEVEEVERIPCPACGIPLRPYSRFCESCGGSVSPSSRPISELLDSEMVASLRDDPQVEKVGSEAPNGAGVAGVAGVAGIQGAGVGTPSKPLRVIPVGLPAAETQKGRRDPRSNQKLRATDRPSSRRDAKGRGAEKATTPPRRSESDIRPGWRSFGWISVAVIISGLVISWWFLSRPKANQTTESPSTGRVFAVPGTTGAVAASTPTGASGGVVPEGMVLIEGGLLRMGRDDGEMYEKPTREVRVAPFFLDLTEVTNEMYLRYVRASGAPPPTHWRDGIYPDGEARFPVVNVSWAQAAAYAEWQGKRLPRESEWEFAARGGDGRLYPWGNEWRTGCANAGDGSAGSLTRVGSFPGCASPSGLLDLSGNAWEWTADRLLKYDNPDVLLAPGRVIRGGAFDAKSDHATTTYRGVVPEGRGYEKTGFRCAMDVK